MEEKRKQRRLGLVRKIVIPTIIKQALSCPCLFLPIGPLFIERKVQVAPFRAQVGQKPLRSLCQGDILRLQLQKVTKGAGYEN